MLRVFMSYTSADQAEVAPFFSKIKHLGFDPWMDCEKLLPGQNWSPQIDQALAEANVVILFISKASLNKRGFVQREAHQAFENLKSKLPDDIYIIPVLLEPCDVPKHISERLQFIEIHSPNAWLKIIQSLKLAADQQQIIIENGAEHGPFRIFEENLSERWHGNPGYDTQVSYPRFESQTQPVIAIALTSFFSGRAQGILISNRIKPWEQDAQASVCGSDSGRWDTYSASFSGQHFLSVCYTVSWYGAGAAHPNSHYECHNFVIIDSTIHFISLSDLFQDWQAASETITKMILKEIQREYWDRTDEFPNESESEWIASGIAELDTHCFSFTDTGLVFYYSPYEVAQYALGSFSAKVPYISIKDHINQNYKNLLISN